MKSDWTTYAAQIMHSKKQQALIYALNLSEPAARLDHYLQTCYGGKFRSDELATLLNIDESDVLKYIESHSFIYQDDLIPDDDYYYFCL